MADDVEIDVGNDWKELKSFPLDNLQLEWRHVPPLYYVDVNGKEWIMFVDHEKKYGKYYVSSSSSRSHSYLYDIEMDEIIPFMTGYWPSTKNQVELHKKSSHLYKSYVIDNNTHIMYCLMHAQYRSLMVAFDIKDLNNVKFIYETEISTLRSLTNGDHTMLLVGNTIQFILGGMVPYYTLNHHEFDTITRKFKLIDENVDSKYTDPNRVTYKKILNCFNNLSIGDVIDVRETATRKFYLAQIVEIKDKEYDNINCGDVKSMKIKVHYQGWDKKYDEWIDITTEISHEDLKSIVIAKENAAYPKLGDVSRTSLCDCKGQCLWTQSIYKNNKVFLKYHRIALLKSQSIRLKSLKGVNAVYSQSKNKFILLGSTDGYDHYGNRHEWGGLYYKRIHHDHSYHDTVTQFSKSDYKMLIYGFVHNVQQNINHLFVNVPKDICQIIFKYYYFPNDKQWTQAEKISIDEKNNLKFERNLFVNHLCIRSGCVVVNDGDDIFIFGGQKGYNGDQSDDIFKLNIATNVLRKLTDIKCPFYGQEKSLWYAVLCKKSQNIHLFHRRYIWHGTISLARLNCAESVVVDGCDV